MLSLVFLVTASVAVLRSHPLRVFSRCLFSIHPISCNVARRLKTVFSGKRRVRIFPPWP